MHDKKATSADLIMAFEGSMVEIETLVKRKIPGNPYYAVVLITFNYVSRPSMNFQSEGYQRGPVHVGRTEMTLRAYSWTEDQIENYKSYRERDDFELLAGVDTSLNAAMDSLGDELKKYLEEAGEEFKEGKKKAIKKKPKSYGAVDPFLALFKGFGEVFTAFTGVSKITGGKKKKQHSKLELKKFEGAAQKTAKGAMWQAYKNYKKAHRMITW
jgi:hypothetical protein